MKHIIFIFAVFFAVQAAIAQPDKAPKEVYKGQQCYVHKVEKGNTLYGISKMYGVKVEDITKHNPDSDKIKPGNLLYIPVPGAAPVITEQPTTPAFTPKEAGVNAKGERVACKMHVVAQGETLYGIARQYGVSVKDIEDVNLFIKDGALKPGMEICIPGQSATPHQTSNTAKVQKDSLHKHVVMPGETVYSLSKRYMLTQDDIKKANNGLAGGLRTGDTLIIPLHLVINRDVIAPLIQRDDTTFVDEPKNGHLKDKYKVVFFIPMYLDQNAGKMSNTSSLKEKSMQGTTFDAVQFYMGSKMALDSLKKAGLSVHVEYVDTYKDTARVGKYLRSDKMKDVDLIIGPYYSSTIKVASDYARLHKIPIIIPIPQNNKMLWNNPYCIKAMASTSSKVDGIVRYIAEHQPGANVVLVDSKKASDADYYSMFRESYNAVLKSGNYPNMIPFKTTTDISSGGLKNQMSKSSFNILVAPSRDLTFVSNLMTRLVGVRNSYDYYNSDFCLFGLDDWERWANLDPHFKHRVNLHFASSTFIDHDSIPTGRFILDFRKNYKTDPSEFAFLGFDVTYSFLAALKVYGTNLINVADGLKADGLHLDLDLIKMGDTHGIENRNVHIIKYENYDLVEPARKNGTTSGKK